MPYDAAFSGTALSRPGGLSESGIGTPRTDVSATTPLSGVTNPYTLPGGITGAGSTPLSGGSGAGFGGLSFSGFNSPVNAPATTNTGAGQPTALGGNFNVGPSGTTQVPFGNSFSTIPTIGSALNNWWQGITGTNTGSLGAQGLNSPQAIAQEAVNQANQYYQQSGIQPDPQTLAKIQQQALAMAQAQYGNVSASQFNPATYSAYANPGGPGQGPTAAMQAGIWAPPMGTSLAAATGPGSLNAPAAPTSGTTYYGPQPLTNTSPYIPPSGAAPSFKPPTYTPTGATSAPKPEAAPASTALSGAAPAAAATPATAAAPNNQTALTNNPALTGNSLLDLFVLSQLFGGGNQGGSQPQNYGVQQTPLGYTQYAPNNDLPALLALLLGSGINPSQGTSGGALLGR